jgi:hypothetical protein
MRIALALVVLLLAAGPGLANAAPDDQTTTPGLIIQSDMVLAGPCVLQSRFSPGDRVVFRAKVYDAQTGQQVTDGTVMARLNNGVNVTLQYEAHPPPQIAPATDEYWVGVWAIPPTTPTGIVRYTVEATAANGRTGTFTPFNTELSLLTIGPSQP